MIELVVIKEDLTKSGLLGAMSLICWTIGARRSLQHPIFDIFSIFWYLCHLRGPGVTDVDHEESGVRHYQDYACRYEN